MVAIKLTNGREKHISSKLFQLLGELCAIVIYILVKKLGGEKTYPGFSYYNQYPAQCSPGFLITIHLLEFNYILKFISLNLNGRLTFVLIWIQVRYHLNP